MKKYVIFIAITCAMILILCGGVAAADSNNSTTKTAVTAQSTDMNTTQLPNNRYIFINVANNEGVKYNLDGSHYNGTNNTYYILANGGGLNQLHITTNTSNAFGQVTRINSTSTNSSGVFYISTTGGQGFNDNIILLLSVKGPISDNFTVHITSSGYNWTVTGTKPTIYNYINGAVNNTFTRNDFQYGPQIYKPGPGGDGTTPSWTLPLYYGQNTDDPSTAQYLMFIDLYVGNLNTGPIDNGAVKVEYSFTGLNTTAAFNAYAWRSATSNEDEGISWTNPTKEGQNSAPTGYSVVYAQASALAASFTANSTIGTSPLTVQFNDTSTGNPTSWAWDFNNDGTVDSTQQNPSYTYSTPGTYTVKLTVTNATGSAEEIKTSYITVRAQSQSNGIVTNLRNGKVHTSIQAAIDDPDTVDGDTLTVQQGTYKENVNIDKRITLNAVGPITINALDVNNPIFNVTLSGAGSTINGFTITGATNSYGIYLNGFANVTNNTITGNGLDGIYINSGNPNITGNNIINNGGNGIYVYSGNANIHFNRILNNAVYGLYMTSSGSSMAYAQNNWWGTNNPTYVLNSGNPPANGISIYDKHNGQIHVTYDPWIILTVNATNDSLKPGTSTTVTADLNHNSNNTTFTGGQIPDGDSVSFNYSMGAVDPVNTTLTNNSANTTMTAGSTTGTANITATVDGFTASKLITIDTIDSKAPTVTASLPDGTYNTTQVTLTATDNFDPDPEIYYSIDNGNTWNHQTKTAVLNLSQGKTSLMFYAVDDDGNQGQTQTATYTIDTTIPTVTANPAGSTFSTAISVNLTTTDNSATTTYYTTDGSDPRVSSTRKEYTGPIQINSTTTLKFAAVDAAGNWSPEYSQTYTISDTTKPVVNATPSGGSYYAPQIVVLKASETANIYYTTDGSDPLTSTTRIHYTSPINIESSKTLRFVAIDLAGNISPVYTQKYQIYASSVYDSWNNLQVDVNSSYNSIAVDSAGFPHIVYMKNDNPTSTAQNTHLFYAYKDAKGWHYETIDASMVETGKFPSITLDSLGRPHVTYYSLTEGQVKYAYRDETGWHIQNVVSNTYSGGDSCYTNIALYNDLPYITFYNYGFKQVIYAHHNGTNWIIERIGTSSSAYGRWNSIKVDKNGVPHVSYYNGVGALVYAVRLDSNNWQTTIVDQNDTNPTGAWSSIALDSSGNPGISYGMLNTGILKYAHWNGTAWSVETILNTGSVSYLNSVSSILQFDKFDNPVIVYRDPTGVYVDEDSKVYYLKYAYKIGTKWITNLVDTVTGANNYISMAIDSLGVAHVSYLDGNDRLRYAYQLPSKMEASPSGGTYYSPQTVTITMNNATTIYYTTDGSNPQSSATAIKYTSPIKITKTTTLIYYGIDIAGNKFPNKTEKYIIIDTKAPTASVNIKGGLYNTSKSVTISMSEAGTIYYTRNGATPTTSSTKYNGPLSITSTTTLKFIAVDAAGNKSPVYIAKYTIDKIPPKKVSVYIKRYASGYSRSGTITLKFSENIKTGINWSKVIVKNKYGKIVSITKWINGNTLYIKTNSKRSSYSYYTVYIPKSAVKDSAGNNFAGYAFRFKTGKY